MTDTITTARSASELLFRAVSLKYPRLAVKLQPWTRPLEQAYLAHQQGDPSRSIQVPTRAGEMPAADVLELVDRWLGNNLVHAALDMAKKEGIRYE